jgi:hypothetical protein
MSRLKVISLFAGPGAGKSTTAAAIFVAMKRLRYRVELVTEYAKDLTYEKNWTRLSDQFHVLSEQNFRLERLRGSVEWAITDSPLPLSLIYCKPELRFDIERQVEPLWRSYENYPFILKRTESPYQDFGRTQTLDEAIALDRRIHELAVEFNPLGVLDPDHPNVDRYVIAQLNHRSLATT